MVSLPRIVCLFVLDDKTERLCAKYWDPAFECYETQLAFEKNVASKAKSQQADILTFQNTVVCTKSYSDVSIYVVGPIDENELIVHEVLHTFTEVLNNLLKNQITKLSLMDNLDLLYLVIDDMIDDGIIFENDHKVISERAVLKDIPEPSLENSTLLEALTNTVDKVMKSWTF